MTTIEKLSYIHNLGLSFEKISHYCYCSPRTLQKYMKNKYIPEEQELFIRAAIINLINDIITAATGEDTFNIVKNLNYIGVSYVTIADVCDMSIASCRYHIRAYKDFDKSVGEKMSIFIKKLSDIVAE